MSCTFEVSGVVDLASLASFVDPAADGVKAIFFLNMQPQNANLSSTKLTWERRFWSRELSAWVYSVLSSRHSCRHDSKVTTRFLELSDVVDGPGRLKDFLNHEEVFEHFARTV